VDNNALEKKIRAGNFMSNNGRVLRTINILRIKYNRLKGIAYALSDMREGEFLDSVNYLAEAEYIELRHIETKSLVTTGLADIDYSLLEAKLTVKGIQLLAYAIKDPLIEV
jgi:hypothetical protein